MPLDAVSLGVLHVCFSNVPIRAPGRARFLPKEAAPIGQMPLGTRRSCIAALQGVIGTDPGPLSRLDNLNPTLGNRAVVFPNLPRSGVLSHPIGEFVPPERVANFTQTSRLSVKGGRASRGARSEGLG